MSKKVTIMRGLSGAGKSTLISRELIKVGEQAAVCSADKFFERPGVIGTEEYPTVYEFDVSKLPEAHAWCMNQFLQALMQGAEHVIVDNTNSRRWEYKNYELAARLAGYEVHIVEIVPQTVEALRVCAERNKHGVPASVIASMAMRWEPDTRATVFNVSGTLRKKA